MEPLIQFRNLEKSYDAGGSKFFVLRRINLDIQPGEFVTIMGPSGAGKSTLLSIIGMLDSAWSWRIFFPRRGRSQAEQQKPQRTAQSQHRLCFPELPPDRQPDRV